METYPKGHLVNLLHQSTLPIFNLLALQTIFQTKSRASLNSIIRSFVNQNVLTQIIPGLYYLTAKPPDQFVIANYLVTPSYISFESALNYHGILPQISFMITSATTKKPKEQNLHGITYRYTHLQTEILFGYELVNNILIATPEKALLDQLYYTTKKYRLLDWDELSLDLIDPKRLHDLLQLFQPVKGYSRMLKTLQGYKLC